MYLIFAKTPQTTHTTRCITFCYLRMAYIYVGESTLPVDCEVSEVCYMYVEQDQWYSSEVIRTRISNIEAITNNF